MAAKRRQCVNCWFYRSADMSGYGWCVHPDRQQESSARLMVRNRELACRNSWGNDLFLHKDTDTPPESGRTANAAGPNDLDDEVTSVVTPRTPGAARPDASEDGGEDRVVSDRPSSRPDNRHGADDGLNDAARIDQEERARVMARGSGDAIASARARYFERRRQGRPTNPDADSPDVLPADEPLDPTGASASDPDAEAGRVVSQQERLSHRFTRHKQSDTFEASREEPVPRSEVEQHHNGSRDRFDSVPAIDPNFDLPGWRRNEPSTPPPSDVSSTQPVEPVEIDEPEPATEAATEEIDEVVDELPIRTYEHVLNRARRIRNNRKPPLGRVQAPASRLADVDLPHHEPSVPDDQWPDNDDASSVAADEEPSGIADAGDLSPAPTVAQSRPQRQGSAQGDRRRSWIARFSGNRDHHTHHPAADPSDRPAIEPSFDQHEAFAADDLSHQHDHTDDSGWQDDTSPAMHAMAEDIRDWDDPYHPSHQDSVNQVWEDDEAQPEYHHRPSYSSQRDHPELAALPDIDDLFATSSPVRPEKPGPAGRWGSRSSSPSVTANENIEVEDVSRRWSADAPYTPRDSFFRSQRYKDWQVEDREYDVDAAPEFADYDVCDDPDAFHDPGHSGQLPDLDASSFDLRDVISRGSELLDMTIDIAPEIPRECRTCRSFRSADGGARGWCTNEWAFTHRRMVNEDDLACETAIGSWWLPDDRYWMPEEDSTWDDATPRMNAFLRRFAATRTRKISGE